MILGTDSRLRDLDSDPASTPYILSVRNVEIKSQVYQIPWVDS